MESIKLSVTYRRALQSKYRVVALAKIDAALRDWIAADAKRGIRTVHVALDDAVAMAALNVPPVTGKPNAARTKRAIDALARALTPHYIMMLGGDDVVPMFHVHNPSFDSDPNGDTDRVVPTDNPYACSRPYRAAARESYLVPDRVVGRIPDLPCAPGAGDPQWLVTPLRHATGWQPRPRSFYGLAYATCTATWRQAGLATAKVLGIPEADLMISPPTLDTTPLARRRLARTLHMTKCHGSEIDARFSGQRGKSFPDILFSDTLAPRIKPGTLVSAVCCYGAQVFAPSDPRNNTPGSLPISITYLAGGAVGFMGSTKVAWVGSKEMMCADWVVASYLKKCLEGASTGAATLEAKQDYMQFLAGQGLRPDTADEKTMIEFVLLGDPSVHPVQAATPAAPARSRSAVAAAATVLFASTAQRGERRAARASLGAQVTKALPLRVRRAAPAADVARRIYAMAVALLDKDDMALFDPLRCSASELRPASSPARAVAARALPARISTEYSWSAKLASGEQRGLRVLKVQVDVEGHVMRSRLLHGA